MNNKTSLIQPEQSRQGILLIRGQRVMLDHDLKRELTMPDAFQYDVFLGHSTKDKTTAPSSSKTSPASNCAPPTADRLLTYPPPPYRNSNQRTPLQASRFT